jgi:hypothetical protein
VSSFDLATGGTRWSVAAGTANDVAGGSAAVPAVADGSLWVPTTGTTSCSLLQINPADGTTIGTRIYDGVPPNVPPSAVHLARCQTGDALAAGSRIVVPSVFNASLDSSQLPGGPFCPPGVDLIIQIVGLSVIDISGAGQGWALDQSASACGPVPAPVPFQPASQSGDLVLVARGTVVTAYPLAACTIGQQCPTAAWSVDTGGQVVGAPVVLSSGDVAVSRADGQVAVIDGTTHAVEWTASVGPRLFLPPAATPTTIYAVSNDSAATRTIVSALPAGGCGAVTCTPTWTSTMLSNPSGRASIGADVVYVTHGRLVSALPAAGCGAATCAPLWEGTAATTQAVSSPPVIENGELLVGNRDGTFAAFSLPA